MCSFNRVANCDLMYPDQVLELDSPATVAVLAVYSLRARIVHSGTRTGCNAERMAETASIGLTRRPYPTG